MLLDGNAAMGLTPMPHGGDVRGIDADAERFGKVILIAGVVLFVISAFYSATEFRYAAFGKSTTADRSECPAGHHRTRSGESGSISESTFSSQTAACSARIV